MDQNESMVKAIWKRMIVIKDDAAVIESCWRDGYIDISQDVRNLLRRIEETKPHTRYHRSIEHTFGKLVETNPSFSICSVVRDTSTHLSAPINFVAFSSRP